MSDNSTPVIMEFYTARIPAQRCWLIVTYAVAKEWARLGAKITVWGLEKELQPLAKQIAISKVRS
jgi:hypothetical protein